jgi:hypothetical protein
MHDLNYALTLKPSDPFKITADVSYGLQRVIKPEERF